MSLTSKLTTIAAAGSGGEPDLFILSVKGTGNTYFADIDVDSSGDIVVVGHANDTSGAGSNDGLILKANPSGDILWSTVTGGTGSDIFQGVSTDSSDNIYAVGYINDSFLQGYIQKVSGSGTIAWEKKIFSSNSRNTILYDCDISTDENTLFFGGTTDEHPYGVNTSVDAFYFGKIATSNGGSLTDYTEAWTYSTRCACVATDDDGSVVFGGLSGYSSTANMDFFLRASQSNIASTTEVFPFGGQNGASVVDVAHGPNNKTWAIVSGNRSWYFDMTNTTVNDDRINNQSFGNGKGVVTDSDGNVYFLHYATNSGAKHVYINKFDDSFNLQWSRRLRGVTTTDILLPYRIAISNNDEHLYICGYDGVSLFGAFIFKCPTDGSLTGTYGDFVYESISQNIGNTSRTNRTNTATRYGPPLPIQNATTTTSTFTPTSTNLEEG